MSVLTLLKALEILKSDWLTQLTGFYMMATLAFNELMAGLT